MNKRGQTMGLAILTSLFVLFAGMIMLNFLMPEITTFRANLSCASPTVISDGVKLLCLTTDATIPYWILIIFSLTIGGITARLYI